MKLCKLVELEPQTASIKFGPEPSIRKLIENYYKPHFPDNYKEHTEDYLRKLADMVEKA